jgi:hypothetical protein
MISGTVTPRSFNALLLAAAFHVPSAVNVPMCIS